MVWIDQTLQADLWLQPSARAAGSRFGKFDQSVISIVREYSLTWWPWMHSSTHRLKYKGEQTNLGAGDLDVTEKYGHLKFTSGEPTKTVLARMGRNSAICFRKFLQFESTWHKVIRCLCKRHPAITLSRSRVSITNYASDLGYIVIPRQVYKQLYHEQGVFQLRDLSCSWCRPLCGAHRNSEASCEGWTIFHPHYERNCAKRQSKYSIALSQ